MTYHLLPHDETYKSSPNEPPEVDSLTEVLFNTFEQIYSAKWIAYYAWKIRDKQGASLKVFCSFSWGISATKKEKKIIYKRFI